jgi:hypothetical protein
MSPGDASPFSASFRQRHCTFACASASSPVTARSCRSNRPSRALRADPLQRHPPDRFRLAPVAHATRIDKVYFDQAPLMRFSSPSALTGRDACCPGQPASGRSRFDVSASRGPRLIRDLHLALVRAVFRRAESLRWCSRVADACERSVPVESVACAWRRHGVGKTACCSHLVRLRPAGQVRAVKPFPHAHDRSNHLERRRCDSAARTGSLRRRVS